MRRIFTLSLLACVAAGAPAAAGARGLQIADMARIVNVEEPAIAPDGSAVALIAIVQDAAAATTTDELLLVSVRDGATRSLLYGRGVAVPRWSPDGARLSYLAAPPGEQNLQVYVRSGSGHSARLTHVPGGVIDAVWSPDGKWIAFVAADQPANAAALAAHHDYFYAGDNDFTATALTPPDHLWIVPSAGGRARRMTSGSWTIAPTDPGGIFSSQIAWSPDGREIAFTRVENTFSGDNERSTIWTIDVRTGEMRKLTEHRHYEESPAYAPVGGRLAYWYPLDGDYNSENTVRVVSADGDVRAAPALDRNVAASVWYPRGGSLLLCAADGTHMPLWRLDSAGALHPLPLHSLNAVCDPYSSATFDSGIDGSISSAGGIAFVGSDARHARELYYLAPGAAAPRRLTHFNDFLDAVALAPMRELDWTGPNGFAEDGVVTTPPACSGVVKCPIVLLIHGGPGLSSLQNLAYDVWPLAQAIASHGYVVFQPNYRGSDNLGNAYMHAIFADSAQGPGEDIMSGLAALEAEPNVDSSRVAVSGWSYGGLLTSWLIGHYHVWRAAVSGAAVNDEFEEYNLSTSNVQDTLVIGTSPYAGDGWRVYSDQSPITYYKQITTPTLIWGTTQDPVVPIPQAYALFHALQDNHVPVRLLVFPATTHGPSNTVQTADLTRIWLDWLDAHLRP